MNSLIVKLGVCLPSGISFQSATPQKICGNLAMHKFHQVKKDACVNGCFAVLSFLFVRIKGALAWVPV